MHSKLAQFWDGQLLNISSLANDIGINRNKTKELIKSPKTYLTDLGLKNALLRNFNPYHLRQDKGAILESFILSTLIQNGKKPSFWNESNQHEMDFVLEEKGRITGIEVKPTLTDVKLSPSVKAFINKHNPHTIYIFNHNIRGKEKLGKTEIIFTHYLNIFSLTFWSRHSAEMSGEL